MAAEAAVSFAVETLGNLLIQEIAFLKGVAGDAEWVRDELRRMQCFLKDASTKQSDDTRIRNWISEIREVAHDAEDAIEMYALKVGSRGWLERWACFPCHLKDVDTIGKEIKSIRQRLSDIERSRQTYEIRDLGGPSMTRSQVESLRILPYWKQDEDVVGLEKDVRIVLNEAILQERGGLSVASIVGMGGIGKSTLAKKIFHHPQIAGLFVCRAWVVVSSEFTVEDIMKQVLLKLGIDISTERQTLLNSVVDVLGRQQILQEELFKHLNGERYFIVLDDVWEPAHWESLRNSFPDVEGIESRLLLTSRNQDMRKLTQFFHKMKVLDSNHSWELFLKKAFTDGKCPEELQNIGKEILEWCGGLPLAISVVGGLLQRKALCKTEWEQFSRELKSELRRNKEIDSISAILELSYVNLPPELKACFLCLAFFKEDASIEVKTLVRIWIAHGLAGGETREDVAKGYLNQLISRNMIQVERAILDNVKTCHVHDHLHHLSRQKAKEEVKLEFLSGEEGACSLEKPRHRSIYTSGTQSVLAAANQNRYLRSLFIQGDTDDLFISPFYWKSFELLRILILVEPVSPMTLSKAIGGLTGLRSIRMRRGYLESGWRMLPCTWAKLVNLEVLDLVMTDTIIDIVILNMDSLRYLHSSELSCRVPLSKMRNLRSLKWFALNKDSVSKIQGVVGLSKLGLIIDQDSSDESISKLFEILGEMSNLVCLKIKVYRSANIDHLGALHRITKLKLYYPDGRLPASFPPNLTHLTLRSYSEDPVPVLERLPELVYLNLEGIPQRTWVISHNGFPKLKILRIEEMGVREIQVEQGGLPVLQEFFIHDCIGLDPENLPQHVQSAIHSFYNTSFIEQYFLKEY